MIAPAWVAWEWPAGEGHLRLMARVGVCQPPRSGASLTEVDGLGKKPGIRVGRLVAPYAGACASAAHLLLHAQT